MKQHRELYFKNDREWRAWLHENHHIETGVYLLFYKVSSSKDSMRWEEAVKVALCYGWIDSTVKKIDHEQRKQYFSRRKPNSVWSTLNKKHLIELGQDNLIHESGHRVIEQAKKNGSWNALDDVENLIIPKDLQKAFSTDHKALKHFQDFAPSYRKNYLYWLHQAKRAETRTKRISEIIRLSAENIKSRT